MSLSDIEAERLGFIRSLKIIDTPIEERFERITRLVSRVFNVPVAAISIVDHEREWFKSICGRNITEVPRVDSVVAHLLDSECPLVINSLDTDSRFQANPLVCSEPALTFVAACPIEISRDVRLGALAIYDSDPREFTKDDLQSLQDFCETAASEMKARLMRNVYDNE